jgi:cytochrome c-type biogenesis protein CcmH
MSRSRHAALLAVICCAAFRAVAADAPAAVCPADDPSCVEKDVSTAFVSGIVGAPRSIPLSGDALERRTDEVARQIRCPVCQGSSIGESPSSTARNMKKQVHELLAAGFAEDQVFAYFEASYGEFIRLAPKAQGFNALVWVLPALLMAAGVVAVFGYLRRRTRKTTAGNSPSPTAEDPDLDPWLRRVRAMAEGTGESR